MDACCIRRARIVLGQLWDSSGKVPGMIVPGYKPQVDKSVDAVYNSCLMHQLYNTIEIAGRTE